MDKPELVFQKELTGKSESTHCFSYAPCCEKCGKSVAVRSVKDLSIEVVKYVEIIFQCDGCGLKWVMAPFRTKKNIPNLKPFQAAQK